MIFLNEIRAIKIFTKIRYLFVLARIEMFECTNLVGSINRDLDLNKIAEQTLL